MTARGANALDVLKRFFHRGLGAALLHVVKLFNEEGDHVENAKIELEEGGGRDILGHELIVQLRA